MDYQTIAQQIRDIIDEHGADGTDRCEALLAHPRAAVTDAQIALLREEMQERIASA